MADNPRRSGRARRAPAGGEVYADPDVVAHNVRAAASAANQAQREAERQRGEANRWADGLNRSGSILTRFDFEPQAESCR